MTLTDRQAADMRAGDAVGKASRTLARHIHANRSQPALGFRNGLIEATRELATRLIDLYSDLPGASEAPLRDELVATITNRVQAFVQSCVAGQHGTQVAAAAREGSQLIASYRMGIGGSFDLAVHDHAKRHPTPTANPPPARRKQDKFEILDSPREYEPDFKRSVGTLGLSVIFFDLDDFKKINTRFTEPVVDRTLLPALQRLILDLVEQRGFAYAEGGDEFVITLLNTNTVLAEAFASLLLERIRTTAFDIDGEVVKVTASAGIASSMDADAHQACREAASKAKRDAKEHGKDRFVVSVLHT